MNKEKILNKYVSMAKMKCPNCRKGNMYTNRSIFPLGKLMDMPTHCPVCNLKYEIEVGFWYGTGYVSYALSVGLIAIMSITLALTIGFSWKDNSVYLYMAIITSSLILLQPFIMRFSRVLYLYVFVKYGEGPKIKSE